MARGSGNLCMYANRVTQGRDVNDSASQYRAKSPIQGRLCNEDLFYRSSTHWDNVLAEVGSYDLHHDVRSHVLDADADFRWPH
jgi:hypothetical protein